MVLAPLRNGSGNSNRIFTLASVICSALYFSHFYSMCVGTTGFANVQVIVVMFLQVLHCIVTCLCVIFF